MNILIGNTGLVGKTLKKNINFDLEFNSKNICDFDKSVIDGSNLWLSCLPATKWMVNKDIGGDINNINSIINIIKNKSYNKIYLISTIDVYSDSPKHSNENYFPNFKSLNYGSNRLLFEHLVTELVKYEKINIFRLPALFSKDIKKNILYDLINSNNVNKININSKYQWYNLDNLVSDMEKLSLSFPSDIVFNIFTEPIDTIDIVNLFPNHIGSVINSGFGVEYDYMTKYSQSGYLYKKDEIIYNIKKLIDEFSFK